MKNIEDENSRLKRGYAEERIKSEIRMAAPKG